MKQINRLVRILAVVALMILVSTNFTLAQGFGGHGYGGTDFYIDENGDGFNDNAPDADGDGIPNGMDDDFVRPMDGSGNGFGPGDGDCDGTGAGQGSNDGNGGYGPGNGNGNGGHGPGDGTGFGPGTGDCINTELQQVRSTRLINRQPR